MSTTAPSSTEAANAALTRLEYALQHHAETTPMGVWRWVVLQRMAAVRDLLVEETGQPSDWLEARRSARLRERNALLDRLSAARFHVLADPDVDQVGYEMRRLVVDLRHHLQRLHDIAYDEVEGELGGSG